MQKAVKKKAKESIVREPNPNPEKIYVKYTAPFETGQKTRIGEKELPTYERPVGFIET